MLQKLSYTKASKFLGLNVFGTVIYAAGITCFTKPHQIAPGGASGIGILVNYATEFPIGLFVLFFNVPLLIATKKYVSKEFVIKTLFSTVLLSFVTDYIVVHFPIYHGNPLLASMFGGASMGIGLALVHIGESNTGGISLLGILIQRKYPQFQVGKLLSMLNLLVVLASGVVFKNIESMLYAIVTIYISGSFMDKIIGNMGASNLLIIISNQAEEIKQVMIDKKNGITLVKGHGGYTNQERQVILCAISKSESEQVQRSIQEVDKEALMIVTENCRINKDFKHVV